MPPLVTARDLQAALPDLISPLRLPGLAHRVEVFRDRWGIPHIRAGSERDAFLAQGFVTAQDRLWHMDFDRHRALGRGAELVGASRLPRDRVLRRMRMARAARADYEASGPAARAMLDAFAEGVNTFIESTKALPIEYSILGIQPEPWQPWHGLAAYKIRNMLMGTYEMKLWRVRAARSLGVERASRLFRGYQIGHLITVPPGELFEGPEEDGAQELADGVALLEGIGAECESSADALFAQLASAADTFGQLSNADGGSNAWVISGERTASGLPLLAGDSHRGLDVPNVYYQVHMACPEWAVSGYSVPGLPGAPHFSHTEFVAFGMTHGLADYQDLFVERFRERDERLEYRFKDSWLPAASEPETLRTREGGEENIEVVATHHGGVIAGEPRRGWGLAFSATGANAGTPWPDAVYLALRARSADELEEAMREWTEPVNNYIYSDTQGNFGYRLRGRIPVRNTSNHWRPVAGWDGKHEWQGMIPFDEMPASRNPTAGYVVTCNQRVTPAGFPRYIGLDFASEYRARRISARLHALEAGAASVAGMSAVHADRTSIPARSFVEAVRSLNPASSDVRAARDLLLAWDLSMDRDSAAAAIYGAAQTHWRDAILESALGNLAEEARSAGGRGARVSVSHLHTRMVTALAAGEDSPLAPETGLRSAAESALSAAVGELIDRLGPNISAWRWGDVHFTGARHPLSQAFPELASLLDPASVAVGGDQDTPQSGAFSASDRFVATTMSVNRYIHDPADWGRSRWIVPLGSSGHPGSPHYADQSEMWAAVETVPQLWDWDEIERETETRQALEPEP